MCCLGSKIFPKASIHPDEVVYLRPQGYNVSSDFFWGAYPFLLSVLGTHKDSQNEYRWSAYPVHGMLSAMKRKLLSITYSCRICFDHTRTDDHDGRAMNNSSRFFSSSRLDNRKSITFLFFIYVREDHRLSYQCWRLCTFTVTLCIEKSPFCYNAIGDKANYKRDIKHYFIMYIFTL